MLHAGLDLSRHRLDVHVLSEEGKALEVTTAPPDRDGLRSLVRHVARDHVADDVLAVIESMNGARFVHDTLELCGWSVEVADARKVKGLAPLACKTDRIDAWVLAELSRRDLVPAIWLPDPAVRADRERARFRLHVVKHRTALKNRIHASLMTFGHPCPVSDLFGIGGRQLLERLQFPEPWRGDIEASLRLIDELGEEIAGIEKSRTTLHPQSSDPPWNGCMDELGPLNLLPRPGKHWAPRVVNGGAGDQDPRNYAPFRYWRRALRMSSETVTPSLCARRATSSRRSSAPVALPLWSCPDCGAEVTNARHVRCEACIAADPRQAPEVRGRRGRAIAARKAALRAWSEAAGEMAYDPDWWARDILPRLGGVRLAEIIEATGCCKATASSWRNGHTTPHVAEWAKLAELVGVEVNAHPLVTLGETGGHR